MKCPILPRDMLNQVIIKVIESSRSIDEALILTKAFESPNTRQMILRVYGHKTGIRISELMTPKPLEKLAYQLCWKYYRIHTPTLSDPSLTFTRNDDSVHTVKENYSTYNFSSKYFLLRVDDYVHIYTDIPTSANRICKIQMGLRPGTLRREKFKILETVYGPMLVVVLDLNRYTLYKIDLMKNELAEVRVIIAEGFGSKGYYDHSAKKIYDYITGEEIFESSCVIGLNNTRIIGIDIVIIRDSPTVDIRFVVYDFTANKELWRPSSYPQQSINFVYSHHKAYDVVTGRVVFDANPHIKVSHRDYHSIHSITKKEDGTGYIVWLYPDSIK